MYGILCLQVYIFFDRFTKERALLKYSVAALWAFSTFYLALVIHPLYIFLIKDFANPKALLNLPWSVAAGVIPTCITNAIVRCWYTYRIWILSEQRISLAVVLLVLMIVNIVTGTWIAVNTFKTKSADTLSGFSKNAWLFYLSLSFGIANDFAIAGALCYQLYKRKSAQTNRNTNNMINILMAYAVNTGLFTAIINVGSIVTYGVMPHNYIFLGIYFTLGPMYVNALMGSLNARDWFRQHHKDHITIPLSTLQISPPSGSSATTDGEVGPSQDDYKPDEMKGDKDAPRV